MQLVTDSKRAYRLAKRVWKGRRAYFELKSLLQARRPLEKNHYRVGVYFADSEVNIYQMRQWYAPLRVLSETVPVLLISRNAAGAETLMRESELDVAYAPKVTSLEKLIESQSLDVILYVNQNTRNFQMMRYGQRWHVFVNHGESDKMYMTSNQHKAYDFAFVAGEAARQRLSRALWDYDVRSRTVMIGRPQADHFAGNPPFPEDGRTVVLYAPTWEGDRPAASYGSVISHGEALVTSLLKSERHRVVYRPHPRSGVVDPEFGQANQRIISAIHEANRAHPDAQHVYDESPELGWQLSVPDIAICDISAMIYDRLATGKPLLVTRPVSPEALVDQTGYLSVCEWLDSAASVDVIQSLKTVLEDPDVRSRQHTWATRYFGDTTPGAPTQRFHQAIHALLDKSEMLRERDETLAESSVSDETSK